LWGKLGPGEVSSEKFHLNNSMKWFHLLGFTLISLLSAIVSPISDCDETYNYWEPLHYVMFGTGLQTWEYAAQYALRSYIYILLHALPLKLFAPFVSRMHLFYLLRICIGILYSFSAANFVSAVESRFEKAVSNALFVFLLVTPGMFMASISFLPQSFAMIFVMFSLAKWIQAPKSSNFQMDVFGIIFFMGVACLIGWPFAGLLALFPGAHIVFTSGIVQPAVIGIGTVVATLGSSIAIDYLFYKKFIIAIWNIIVYNRVEVSGEGGADIYGTEPASFYFINLFLNLNLVFFLAMGLPFICVVHYGYHKVIQKNLPAVWYLQRLFFSSGCYVFFLVFLSMAHKEERFFYPAYPIFCLAAACSVGLLLNIGFHPRSAKEMQALARLFYNFILVLVCLLSFSRIVSQVSNFGAPLKIYNTVSTLQDKCTNSTSINVCVGKEWYRFPTSFFLPSSPTKQSNLLFVKAGFTGQLPQPYGNGDDATSRIAPNFNNMNKEEVSRYSPVTECDYIVEWDIEGEPMLQQLIKTGEFTVVQKEAFLKADNSKSPFRSFYLPVDSKRFLVFRDYVLLKRVQGCAL
jgi:alpha-1,2-mannosyltransferase